MTCHAEFVVEQVPTHPPPCQSLRRPATASLPPVPSALVTVTRAFLMSSLPPPRRSARKRTLRDVISDEGDTASTSASFSAKLAKFAHSTSPDGKIRPAATRPIPKSEQDFSGNSPSDSQQESPSTSIVKAKVPRPTKKKSLVLALNTPHPAPPRWRETYEAISEMRKHILAPVDGMGCANAGDAEQDPKVRFKPRSTVPQPMSQYIHASLPNDRANVSVFSLA